MIKRYGIPGQRQHGVDIFDPTYTAPFHAAQCKLREAHKGFRAKELRAEVDEAKHFTPKLGHYAIVTTAKIPTETDDELIAINKEHSKNGLFVVEIIKYDDLAESFPQVVVARLPVSFDASSNQISELSEIKVKLDTLLEHSPAGGPGDEVSDALKDVTAKRYSTAYQELTRIREKRWDKLTLVQRYDVTANLAVCSIALNEPLRAAKLFLEAVQFKPNDERARTNVALAHALNDSPDEAHSLAWELMQEFPASARAAALWVSTAPRNVGLSDLEGKLSSGLLEEPEVNVALGYRALLDDHLQQAKEYATRASSKALADSRTWMLLGAVLLRMEIDPGIALEPRLLTQEKRQRLLDAKAATDKAVETARGDNSLSLLVSALVQRSNVRECLGDSEGREADIREAQDIDPNRADVVRNYGALLIGRGQLDEAIKALKSISLLDEDRDYGTRYILGTLLSQRKGDGDIREAVSLFITVAKAETLVTPGLRSHVLQRCIELWDDSELEATLRTVKEVQLDDVERGVLECRVLMRKANLEGAKVRASNIIGAIPASILDHSTLRLSELLSDLEMYREAFPFWQRVTDKPEVLPLLHRRFLESAYYAGEDSSFIDRCELLRIAGLADPNLVHAEIDVLEKYDVEACVEILKEYLGTHPDDLETRLRLSVAGYHLNRPDLIYTSSDSIPDVQTVRPQLGLAAVQIQKMRGSPQIALEYAYTLARLHPADPDAQRAMLFALHPFGPKPDVPNPMPTVTADSSVEYLETGEASSQWITIEGSNIPVREFPCVAPESRLASLDYSRSL